MNNAVYDKTMENLRNRIDVKLVSCKKDDLKWIPKPSYMSQKIFDNDLVAIRKNKITLTLNKPAYVGICILDLGKVLMYEFQYYYIKNEYGNNSRLLFTDTDSLWNVRFNPKMYSFSVDDSDEHKEAKGVNRNVFAAISHGDTR